MVKQKKSIIGLVAVLILVVLGGVLFVGAVSGWFDSPKVILDAEYLCGDECDGEFAELSAGEYDQLVADKKSFIVFVDQGGCTTADRLRGYVADFAKENGYRIYRMMFEDVRKSSLHEYVEFYPSVAMVSRGEVIANLRADADEDADAYNDYDEFVEWIRRYL